MSEARSTDLSSVKHKGMKYVPENMHNNAYALDPAIPEVEDKSMRGIYHPQLARLLCPRRDLEEFDEDPDWYVTGMVQMFASSVSLTSLEWYGCFAGLYVLHEIIQVADVILRGRSLRPQRQVHWIVSKSHSRPGG